MELDRQSLFGLLCTAVFIGRDPATHKYEGAISQIAFCVFKMCFRTTHKPKKNTPQITLYIHPWDRGQQNTKMERKTNRNFFVKKNVYCSFFTVHTSSDFRFFGCLEGSCQISESAKPVYRGHWQLSWQSSHILMYSAYMMLPGGRKFGRNNLRLWEIFSWDSVTRFLILLYHFKSEKFMKIFTTQG